jgi:hypothetical protein
MKTIYHKFSLFFFHNWAPPCTHLCQVSMTKLPIIWVKGKKGGYMCRSIFLVYICLRYVNGIQLLNLSMYLFNEINACFCLEIRPDFHFLLNISCSVGKSSSLKKDLELSFKSNDFTYRICTINSINSKKFYIFFQNVYFI